MIPCRARTTWSRSGASSSSRRSTTWRSRSTRSARSRSWSTSCCNGSARCSIRRRPWRSPATPTAGARGVATVGWLDALPAGDALLAAPIWRELLTEGHTLVRAGGELAGRPYEQLLAAPLSYRGVFLGYVAVLDKEVRGDADRSFTADDRRFLDSVTALAGAALDAARQVERLETQRERLEEENKALKGRLAQEVAGRRIVAHAPPMRRVLDLVERVAPRGVSVPGARRERHRQGAGRQAPPSPLAGARGR